MNPSPLNIGFLGGALDSAVGTTHALASGMDRQWKLSAGCFSQDESMNLETATHWGVGPERVYGHWRALLEAESEKLDAIAILTPTPRHAEMVLAALELGYAVICEKSLCTNMKEADQLRAATKQHGGFLAVIYNYTGYPMLREMRSRVQNGELGNINQLHIEMPQEGYLKLDRQDREFVPQGWRLIDGPIPTLHLDLGVHIENLVYFLTGERADQVLAKNNTYGHFSKVVDNTLCLARYPGNIDCNLWFGKSALGYSNGLRVRIFGSRGAMEWHQMEPDVILTHDNHGSTKTLDPRSSELLVASESRYNRFKPGHPNGFIEAFSNYYSDLADAVRQFNNEGTSDNPWVFGINDAWEGMAMMNAMQLSASRDQWCSTNPE